MPRLKRTKKDPPEGFDTLAETLEELDQKMREGMSHETIMVSTKLSIKVRPFGAHFDSPPSPFLYALSLSSLLISNHLTLAIHSCNFKLVENESHEGKRKKEALWPIFRIHHQRSRFIYEMYFKHKAISKEVYQYCLDEKLADAELIAKWKKTGYEKLCCLSCIQTKDTQFGGTCICRVPLAQRNSSKPIECANCGCLGCASGD